MLFDAAERRAADTVLFLAEPGEVQVDTALLHAARARSTSSGPRRSRPHGIPASDQAASTVRLRVAERASTSGAGRFRRQSVASSSGATARRRSRATTESSTIASRSRSVERPTGPTSGPRLAPVLREVGEARDPRPEDVRHALEEGLLVGDAADFGEQVLHVGGRFRLPPPPRPRRRMRWWLRVREAVPRSCRAL
jgi:hypothetical protein